MWKERRRGEGWRKNGEWVGEGGEREEGRERTEKKESWVPVFRAFQSLLGHTHILPLL